MEEKFILGFACIENFGSAKLRKIKKYFSSFEKAWQSADKEDFILAGIEEKFIEPINRQRNSFDLNKAYEKLCADEIQIITEESKLFPSQLKEIKSAPYILFCRGNIELLKRKQIGIVGSRKPTNYGQLVTQKITAELGQTGLVLTSGLAKGIDAISHRTALDHNHPTIAVLASGINEQMLRQATNYSLAKEIIAKGGLVISEFPPDFPAGKYTFPARNRIISGLSLGVLVVEAGEKSGSLITAGYALEQNREVFSVPGSILSEQSAGTNKLIKEGAVLCAGSQDILEALNFSFSAREEMEKTIEFQDKLEEKIYKLLSYEPMHVNQIIQKTKEDPSQVSMKISMMELRGMVKTINGGIIKN